MNIYKKSLIGTIILYLSLTGCFFLEAINNLDSKTKSNKPKNKSTNYAGVNLSRYRSATKGCYVILKDGGGYWSESCKIVSADDAVKALTDMGIKKVKVFAPGPYPQHEYKWYSPLWEEDIKALDRSGENFELFIGIPNSILYQIAGIDFSMTCGSGDNQVTFRDPEPAAGSQLCGEDKHKRHEKVLHYLIKKVQSLVEGDVSITCSKDASFSNAELAYKSPECSTEQVFGGLVEALIKSDGFMSDTKGISDWMNKHVLDLIGKNSKLKLSYIGVGNEPYAPWHHDIYDLAILPAMKKTQTYLTNSDNSVLSSTVVTVPFAGTFGSKPILVEQVLTFLEKINSIFMQNIYPHSDVFSSTLNNVVQGQKALFPDRTDDKRSDTLFVTKQNLAFIRDFIAWGIGAEGSGVHNFNTGTFYEAYMNGYKNALAYNFSKSYDLKIVAGETGWPSDNKTVYIGSDVKTAKSIKLEDLVFDKELENGEIVAKVKLNVLKQMISNEMFNANSAGSFTNSTAEYWKENNESGYFFELIDEVFKVNEAEGMAFELEAHFGLMEVVDNSKSTLKPKFKMTFN